MTDHAEEPGARWLDESQDVPVQTFGVTIATLGRLARNGVAIVPSLVIPNTAFEAFSDEHSLPEPVLQSILRRVAANSRLSAARRLVVRSSLEKPYIGINDSIAVDASRESLKYGVEFIYRSWYGDRAQASRVLNDIMGSAGHPALMIQPSCDAIGVLSSRTGRGDRTSENNYSDSVCNSIREWRAEYSAVCAQVERILQTPVLIEFSDDQKLEIVDARRHKITTEGLLHTLDELASYGNIDPVSLLEHIEPGALTEVSEYAFPDPRTIRLEGLPISPGQVVAGYKVLHASSSDPRLFRNRIVVFDEFTPEDVAVLHECVGSIGRRGGATSHLALVSRGFHKPCVICPELSVDRTGVTLRIGKDNICRDWNVYLNGSSGVISFSASPSVAAKYTIRQGAASLVARVADGVSQLQSDQRAFAALSVETQLRIAKLIREVREVGLIE